MLQEIFFSFFCPLVLFSFPPPSPLVPLLLTCRAAGVGPIGRTDFLVPRHVYGKEISCNFSFRHVVPLSELIRSQSASSLKSQNIVSFVFELWVDESKLRFEPSTGLSGTPQVQLLFPDFPLPPCILYFNMGILCFFYSLGCSSRVVLFLNFYSSSAIY